MLQLKFSSKLIHSISAQRGLTQKTNLVHSASLANTSWQMGLCKSGREDLNLVCQQRAAMVRKSASIITGKFKHQLNLKCGQNSPGMFSNNHSLKITRIWIARCLCEGQNIPCLFFFSIALDVKKYMSNCTPGTVWIVISSTSALSAALWGTTFRYKSLIRARESSRKTQTKQIKEGGSLVIRRAKLKWQIWQRQPSPEQQFWGPREGPPLLLIEGISQLCKGTGNPSPAVKLWVWLGKASLSSRADTICTGHCNLSGSTGNDLS